MVLNVAHVIDDYTPANGGLTTALQQLTRSLAPLGVESTVYCVGSAESRPGLVTCPPSLPGGFRLSRPLIRQLTRDLERFDVVHVHGIWLAPQLAALTVARALRLPTLLTPHNMLGGWLWRRSVAKRLKKSAYFGLFGSLFRGVDHVQALSPVEAETLRAYFPKTPISIVPNGIELDATAPSYAGTTSDGAYMLYLGRLVEGKGLELLIDAFARSSARQRYRLVIAGAAQARSFEQMLRRRVQHAGLEPLVDFVGHVSGLQKAQLLGGAQALFLPSFAEGVSMVALESLAAGTPLVASAVVGVPENAQWGGLTVALDVDSVCSALEQASTWSAQERMERGRRSQALARERYAWTAIGPRMRALYEDCLHVARRPRPADGR